MHLLLLTLACSDGPAVDDSVAANDSAASDDSADDSATSDDSADDSASADDSGGGDGSPPTLSACYAECYLHDVGDQAYWWQLGCVATDPDGLGDGDDVRYHRGAVDVTQSGSVVHSDIVACGPTGECTASFSEPNSGVICAQATQYTFTIVVTDAEGHSSQPVSVQGRQR